MPTWNTKTCAPKLKIKSKWSTTPFLQHYCTWLQTAFGNHKSAPNITPTRFLRPVHIFSSFGGFRTTSHSDAESSKSFNSKSSTWCCAARSHDSTTEAYLASQSSMEVSTQDPKDDYISIPCQGWVGINSINQLAMGIAPFFGTSPLPAIVIFWFRFWTTRLHDK